MKIEHTNVVDQILNYLKSNISTGVWKPGEKIDSELKLVEQLHVSRASIHNAIQQLIALGVLESFQGKGTFVKSIPTSEIQNRLEAITKNSTMHKLIEFRLIVEVGVCRQIATQISENTINEMASYLEGMKQYKHELKKFVKYDIRFHRALLQATQNEIIVQSIDIIRDEMQRQSLKHATIESIEEAIRYHERIVDCLRVGDSDGAAAAMFKHLQSTPQEPQFFIKTYRNCKVFSHRDPNHCLTLQCEDCLNTCGALDLLDT